MVPLPRPRNPHPPCLPRLLPHLIPLMTDRSRARTRASQKDRDTLVVAGDDEITGMVETAGGVIDGHHHPRRLDPTSSLFHPKTMMDNLTYERTIDLCGKVTPT